MRRLVLPLLAGSALLAFWPVLDLGFVNFDDPKYVTENPHVQAGLDAASIRWAWTTGHVANWHPLTWLSHMVDWELFGAAPAGHHATNLAFHVVNTLLLHALLVRTTGAVGRSALVAALFALHPLRVESVAWVSERKDVLSTCLWLCTTHAWVGWVRGPSRLRYALVALLLALGLTAKPMLVTLPATLLLLDHWPLGRLRALGLWRCVREKLPLVPLVVASAVVTVLVQAEGGSVATVEQYPLATRAANAIVSYVTYLGMWLWPQGLAVLYPHPGAPGGWKLGACALALVLVTALVVLERTRRSYLIVGWLWYVGTLVPVIGLVQAGGQALADRYTYVPTIGIAVAVAWLVPLRPLVVVAPAVAAALVALGTATRAQVAHWRDSETLFGRALAVEERNPVAHANLAFALAARGETDAAENHFERALALRPGYLTVLLELGSIRLGRGDASGAAARYSTALAVDPTSAHAATNLGLALAAEGRAAEAIAMHERAVGLAPDLAVARVNLGSALADVGRTAEARGHFERAVALEPGNAGAQNNLGSVLLREGRPAESLARIDRALALRPTFGLAHANRAAALLYLGRHAEAWESVARARAAGHEPPAALLRLLAARMPPP